MSRSFWTLLAVLAAAATGWGVVGALDEAVSVEVARVAGALGETGPRVGAPTLDGDDVGASARRVFARPLMGTEFRIVVHGPEGAALLEVVDRAFARVAELESVLSDYDPESELSRLSTTSGTGRWVPVSDDLWAVLSGAREWSERTGGAFDPTVGSLTRIWRRAVRRGTVPSAAEIDAARDPVGYRGLHLAPERRAVRLERTGTRLDVGGIGKGFAADAALDVLMGLGFTRVLVDAGGDVVAGDAPPGEEGWRVELPPGTSPDEPVRCVVRLVDAALATSGASERSVEVDGVRHSHILDPRTGAALTAGRLVTVVAPTATEADVLASSLSVLGPVDGGDVVRASPDASARIVEPDGAVLRLPGPAVPRPPFPDCGSDHGA